jgi:hypothetical protein
MLSRTSLAVALIVLAAPACSSDPDPIASGEMTDQLPADRINQVLSLQPGVIANSGGPSLSFRGERGGESVTYVDGVPVQQGNRGNAFTVATNGFQEASVTAGASAAEFGNARSGVISIETRSGRVSTDTASLPTMLIRTGNAQVRVDSLEPAIAALEALARQSGGYIGNTSFMGGEERRRQAYLQIRVPSSRFGDLQTGLSALGKVLSQSVNVQDVGEEYTDAAARLRSKRQVETRLLDLLRTRVGKLSDVVELEEALEEVREEIESTEGRLRYLSNQVGLSTMTVMLSEPGLEIAEPGYHPIRDSFGAAWRNFTLLIAGTIAAMGWLLPLLFLAYLGWKALMRTLARRRAVA